MKKSNSNPAPDENCCCNIFTNTECKPSGRLSILPSPFQLRRTWLSVVITSTLGWCPFIFNHDHDQTFARPVHSVLASHNRQCTLFELSHSCWWSRRHLFSHVQLSGTIKGEVISPFTIIVVFFIAWMFNCWVRNETTTAKPGRYAQVSTSLHTLTYPSPFITRFVSVAHIPPSMSTSLGSTSMTTSFS